MYRQRKRHLAPAALAVVMMGAAFVVQPLQAWAATVSSTIPVGSAPVGVAYDAANGDVYVTNNYDGTVSVIDGSTNTVTSISVGSNPAGVAYDAANGDVYVTNSSAGTVSVIDGSTNTVTSTIAVGSYPYGVAYDAANGDVYVTNYNSGTVSVIDGSTNTVTSTITVGTGPHAVVSDAANGDVYVANLNSNTVSVIDVSRNTVTSISVGSSPAGVAYDAANGDVYVTNDSAGTVSVIDGSTNTVTGTITVGSAPEGVAYDAANGDVYVANFGSSSVSVINGSNNTVTSIPVGSSPDAVAYDAANGDVYVTNKWSNTVSVIVPPVPAITHSSVGPGSTIGTTAITATPNTSGDTFAVQVTSTPPSAVGDGALLPAGTTAYTSGTDISHVAVGDVVTLYEVNSGGSVVADTSMTLIANNILWATVTYDANGASGSAPTDSNQYMTGASVTLAGQGNLTKTGYLFAGWNTKADGSGTSYAANSTLTMPATNVTLYAQWLTNPAGLQHQNVTQTGWTESWTAVSGASSYNVYLNNSKVGTVTNTVYDFTGEQPGTTYSVTIASVNGLSVTSPQSNADSVTTLYNAAGVPTGLQHSHVTTTGWQETWSPVSGAGVGTVTYAVYVNGSEVGTTSSPSYDFTGMQPGMTYSVTIASVNGMGQVSAASSPDAVTTSQMYIPLAVGTGWAWNGQYGVPYNTLRLQAASGHGPYTWSLVQGSLPSGLTLSTDGTISGTPDGKDETSTFTVQVTDANGGTAKQSLSITISGAPSLAMTTASLPAGSEGKGYSVQLGATGVSPLNWSVVSGILPNGLSLNSDGLLSGTPLESGQFSFTVQVAEGSGNQVQRTLTLAIQALGSSQRIVTWDGDTRIVPAVVQNDTTYMPIWYVMQWLKSMGIQSTWDGQNWALTTSSQPDLSNLQVGNGHKDIDLNGTLVQKVNSVVAADPSTENKTTYMPIWYVMQLLNRVGLHSTWDGTVWTVTK